MIVEKPATFSLENPIFVYLLFVAGTVAIIVYLIAVRTLLA